MCPGGSWGAEELRTRGPGPVRSVVLRGLVWSQVPRTEVFMSHPKRSSDSRGRLQLAQCVVDQCWGLRRAACGFQVSVPPAALWSQRYREHGPARMEDPSSRPHSSPRRTPRRSVRSSPCRPGSAICWVSTRQRCTASCPATSWRNWPGSTVAPDEQSAAMNMTNPRIEVHVDITKPAGSRTRA